MTYDVGVNISRHSVTPDIYDWLEDQGMEYYKDWRFERGSLVEGFAEFDYVFKFVRSEHAMMFKLRWQ